MRTRLGVKEIGVVRDSANTEWKEGKRERKREEGKELGVAQWVKHFLRNVKNWVREPT